MPLIHTSARAAAACDGGPLPDAAPGAFVGRDMVALNAVDRRAVPRVTVVRRCGNEDGANWGLPSAFDVLSRLDIGAGARQWQVRGRALPNLDRLPIPARAAEPTGRAQRAVRIHIATVAPFPMANAEEAGRKLYCVSPPAPQ